ncbi:MAG: ATP-dependent zinc metalloprotease FtsH [Massiliimalia sp.]
MQNKKKIAAIYAVILAVLVGIAFFMTRTLTQPGVDHKYSDIIYLFQDEKVDDFTLDIGNGELELILKEGVEFSGAVPISQITGQTGDNRSVYTYKIHAPQLFLDDIKPYVEQYNENHPDDRMTIDYEATSDNSWMITMIPSLLMFGLMIFFFVFMMRQASAGGKMSQFGKSNMKNPVQHGVKTTFADVAGADEEKEELAEIVEFLKNPKKFSELGARIPKGVLLLGPPGTGKTLLARAVAGEAGVPFFSISGSDFVEMFVGVGASRVRDLFESAKKNAPSIIFIDEIDAVGRHRGAGLGGGHDEREQTLNQLLVEMDGFGMNQGIIVIAATNRRDILDPALLRPGRFDRQVVVNYPDVDGREAILKVHARNKPLGFDVDLKTIARSTAGFTGADLENLLNEAALLAARKGKKAITGEDIEEATIKVVAGPEKRSHKMHFIDKRITAYHEAGHAIVGYYCPTQDPVHEISIIPRGMAAGYTMNLPEDDRTHMSKQKMEESLSMMLGGRVAEAVALDDICTGASNDIERATKTARDMVTRYGFSSRLGPIVYGEPEGEVFLGRDMGHQRNYSEEIAAVIDEEIRQLIDKAYKKAENIVRAHFDQLDLVAKYLLVYEKVDAQKFKDLMAGKIALADVEAELQKLDDPTKPQTMAVPDETENADAQPENKE